MLAATAPPSLVRTVADRFAHVTYETWRRQERALALDIEREGVPL